MTHHTSSIRVPLVIGNWKMNGSIELLKELTERVTINSPANLEIGVCPPYPFLGSAQVVLGKSLISLGAQDVSCHSSGAYTGEVSAEMLKEVGCQFVLIGHSERRQYHHETNEQVAIKTQACLSKGLKPVVCVGETLTERDNHATETVVTKQLETVLSSVDFNDHDIVIAYEPVWAIGTGKTASPEQAQKVHQFIRKTITDKYPESANTTRLLYGGSVKPGNATTLFSQPDIDGGLIGGASLNAQDFLLICNAANV